MNPQSHRCFQTQSLRQPIKNIILKRYFFYPRSKVAKAFTQKSYIRTKSLVLVYFYDITLQQCHSVSLGKHYSLGFTVPCCASHCFACKFFQKNLCKCHNFCKYVEQMVITDILNSENQLDCLEGIRYTIQLFEEEQF